MDVKQVADIVNGMTVELLGDSAVTTEDLSNVVDMGKAILDNTSYDKFVPTLIDYIGRVMFVNRAYTGWEYGVVMEKITETPITLTVSHYELNITSADAVTIMDLIPAETEPTKTRKTSK